MGAALIMMGFLKPLLVDIDRVLLVVVWLLLIHLPRAQSWPQIDDWNISRQGLPMTSSLDQPVMFSAALLNEVSLKSLLLTPVRLHLLPERH